jgi:hypothetical protein
MRGRDAYRADHQRVAVGRGLCHLGRADVAAGAGFVVHQQLLAPDRRQRVGNQAAEDVGDARRREGHDQAHRLVRIAGGAALGEGVGREQREGGRGQQQAAAGECHRIKSLRLSSGRCS